MNTQQLIQIYLDLIATLQKTQDIHPNPNTHALIVSFKFRVQELREELAQER